MTIAISVRSGLPIESHQNPRFVIACKHPNQNKHLSKLAFERIQPPNIPPNKTANNPTPLLTAPTSAGVNPAPRIRKAVDRDNANASPNLYKIMVTKIRIALVLEKNSLKGSLKASLRDFGEVLVFSSGHRKTNIAKTNTTQPNKK